MTASEAPLRGAFRGIEHERTETYTGRNGGSSAHSTAMEIIVLIPTVLCLALYFRYPVYEVFLNLYIPLFALFPLYFYWKVAALPPIDVGDAILLPLGLGILLKEMRSWRLSSGDFWLAVFAFTAFYADHLAGRQTNAIFSLFQVLCTAVVPYMAGKVLIEQHNARASAVRRLVFCLFVAAIISTYEYKMSFNPFTLVWARFFPTEVFAWKTQLRWGFGRVAGPFGQSELAGIVLMTGVVLALWLMYSRLWERKFAYTPWLPLRKATVITATLVLVLLMTQARGPWLGTLLAIPVAFIGRSKRVVRTSVFTALAIAILGTVAYIAFQHYLHAPTASDEQQTAQYRQQLVTNYLPIVEQGGAWGWGSFFPKVPGQESIDNQYLLVVLVQGYVGLLAFCLIALETLARMLLAAGFAPTRYDRTFAFSLLGIFAGVLFTIYTVFLGNQPYQLFFLLAGWAQALPTRKAAQPELSFQHVYS